MRPQPKLPPVGAYWDGVGLARCLLCLRLMDDHTPTCERAAFKAELQALQVVSERPKPSDPEAQS